MGRRHKGRSVNGILLLNKPLGMTSNRVLQIVKRCFQAAKAGHTGSLDPAASGLLPICFGEATKVSNFLLDSDKEYITTVQLGQVTNTADAEGEVIESKSVGELIESEVQSVLTQFLGEIAQVPPMHSALKQDGKRLYELAHKGIEVERKARQITIHVLQLLDIDNVAKQIRLQVSCSKGTYIRTLAEDIGKAMGCGAHVLTLHRIKTGPFSAEQMIDFAKIDEFEGDPVELDEFLLPCDSGLMHLEKVVLSQELTKLLMHGQTVAVENAPSQGELRLYSDSEVFLGIGETKENGQIAPKRLFNID